MSENVVAIVVAIFASTGFWSLVQYIISIVQEKKGKDSSEKKLLVALSHDRILWLCRQNLERGYITHEDYVNLSQMVEPYFEAGGNHLAEKYWQEVKELPIKDEGK